MTAPSARQHRTRWFLLALIPALIFIVAWSLRRCVEIEASVTGRSHDQMIWIWVFVFGALIWHWGLAWTERTHTATPRQRRQLDELRVKVNVPVFNEDPATLRLVLESLLAQTRPADLIEVVENGIHLQVSDLTEVREWFLAAPRSARTEVSWLRIEEAGKRAGQLPTLQRAGYDIMVTTDSDTVPAPDCLEEGMLPFRDQRVTSVASVILAQNPKAPLVLLTDAWLCAFQLATRAAMSRLGCVLVNSGNFALYRMAALEKYLDVYEHETFAGAPVQFSDDSMLTLFAHTEGKTVQQPSSFAFTVLPERVGHHLKQQMRWMRGSTIRSFWRFRYLRLNGWAYWEHFLSWVNFALITFAFGYLVVYSPIVHHGLAPAMLLFAVAVGYLTSLRYLTIRRTDIGFRWQLLAYSLAPVMMLWTALVLRPMRFYAMATCWRTGWGTRGKVEVTV